MNVAEEIQSLGGTDYVIASRPFAALLGAQHRPFPRVASAGFAMEDVQVRAVRAECVLCAATTAGPNLRGGGIFLDVSNSPQQHKASLPPPPGNTLKTDACAVGPPRPTQACERGSSPLAGKELLFCERVRWGKVNQAVAEVQHSLRIKEPLQPVVTYALGKADRVSVTLWCSLEATTHRRRQGASLLPYFSKSAFKQGR